MWGRVDPRPGRGAAVAVHGDVANRLKRLVGQRVVFARDRIEMRVAAEARFERAIEVGPADTRQLVVKFDRNAARLDDRAERAADIHEVRIDIAVTCAFAGPGERLAAQDSGGVTIEDEAAAEPFRLPAAQPQSVRHPRTGEPVMAREAHLVQVIDRVGANPQKASCQCFRDMADDLEIEGGHLALERRKICRHVRRASAVRRGDSFSRLVHDHRLL